MSVRKLPCEAYHLRTAERFGEHGTVYLREWQQEHNGSIHYGGEIVANTSFGVYGHYWTHCGVPFKRFLTGLEFHYFMEKACEKFKEFDFDASLASIRRAVIEHRKDTSIDKPTAAAIWSQIKDIESSGNNGGHQFVADLYAIDELRRVTQEPYEYAREHPTAQAVGFWRELWPLLVAELKREIEPVKTEAA